MQISGTSGATPAFFHADTIAGPPPAISPDKPAPIAAPSFDELPPAVNVLHQAEGHRHAGQLGAGAEHAHDEKHVAERVKEANEASADVRFTLVGHGPDASVHLTDSATGAVVRELTPHQFMGASISGLLLDVHR